MYIDIISSVKLMYIFLDYITQCIVIFLPMLINVLSV